MAGGIREGSPTSFTGKGYRWSCGGPGDKKLVAHPILPEPGRGELQRGGPGGSEAGG